MKSIIITGTRKGIGLELSRYYLSQGWLVFGCSRRPSSIEHENYTHFELDIADEKSVKHMIREVFSRSENVYALVNNAGVASMNHLLLTPLDTVNHLMHTNFTGTFLFMREFCKYMSRKKSPGRIINFSTVAVPMGIEGEAIYASSKSAVESLTRSASAEFAPFNVTVNTLGPCPIKTDLIQSVPKEKIKQIIDAQAISRLGTIEDVIHVVDFYLSEKSEMITGQTLYLGGVS